MVTTRTDLDPQYPPRFGLAAHPALRDIPPTRARQMFRLGAWKSIVSELAAVVSTGRCPKTGATLHEPWAGVTWQDVADVIALRAQAKPLARGDALDEVCDIDAGRWSWEIRTEEPQLWEARSAEKRDSLQTLARDRAAQTMCLPSWPGPAQP
jgi:hypothetical protein